MVTTHLDDYTRCAEASAACVIRSYSTSFGMATRLFNAKLRPHIRNIYALVRVADEIVDGSAGSAGMPLDAQRELLDTLEADTQRALREGYSANLIVHAFAHTARVVGIDADLTRPFFSSMRRDLDSSPFTSAEVVNYIYGSAEVVGLMCLRVFLADSGVTAAERAELERGACALGAAFQKVNFVRDLANDWRVLGRNYFPHLDLDALTEAHKNALLDDIDADLANAAAVIPRLPRSCRGAVLAAHDLFRSLSARLRATPADELLQRRVSVPTREKALILLRARVHPSPRAHDVARADPLKGRA